MSKGAMLIAALLLAGCDNGEYKCINGTLYYRYPSTQKWWRQVDGAPTHSGITPVPCKEDKDGAP
jgi:hypothetical protein